MDSGAAFVIEEVPYDDPMADLLRQAQRVEILSAYGFEPGTPPSALDIAYFAIVLYKSKDNEAGIPIGCGGLRLVQDSASDASRVFEIKRMFVHREYRGSRFKIGNQILIDLEAKAMQLGSQKLVLETGKDMLIARRFYENHGYRLIPNFGDYDKVAHSVCYGKTLA